MLIFNKKKEVMYLMKRIIIVVFLVITVNAAYSQKKENKYYSFDLVSFVLENFPKDFSNDTILYIYIDSNIVNGLAVYTDSIKVDISTNGGGLLVRGNSNSYVMTQDDGERFFKIHYPIPLTDNPLFKKAIYRDDNGLTGYIVSMFHSRQNECDIEEYVILSSDDKYINYAFLNKKDGDLYAKYNPLDEGNGGTVTIIKRKKLQSWLSQETETNKNKIISIVKLGKVYIARSFHS